MPVQFPTLSTPEQTDRVTKIAKNTLFPYSYPFYFVPSANTFKGSVLNSYAWMPIGFQADNNLAISNLEVQYNFISVNAAASVRQFVVMLEVSYSPQVEGSPLNPSSAQPDVPTPIPDTGNIIYRNFQQQSVAANASPTTFNVNDFRRYEPYNYVLKFNQILYVHFVLSSAALGTGSDAFWTGSIIFHTLPTGQKS